VGALRAGAAAGRPADRVANSRGLGRHQVLGRHCGPGGAAGRAAPGAAAAAVRIRLHPQLAALRGQGRHLGPAGRPAGVAGALPPCMAAWPPHDNSPGSTAWHCSRRRTGAAPWRPRRWAGRCCRRRPGRWLLRSRLRPRPGGACGRSATGTPGRPCSTMPTRCPNPTLATHRRPCSMMLIEHCLRAACGNNNPATRCLPCCTTLSAGLLALSATILSLQCFAFMVTHCYMTRCPVMGTCTLQNS